MIHDDDAVPPWLTGCGSVTYGRRQLSVPRRRH
jgi:hypothetical protein